MANLWTGSDADDSSLHPGQDVGTRQHGQVRIILSCLLSLVGSVLGHLVHFSVEWCANDSLSFLIITVPVHFLVHFCQR